MSYFKTTPELDSTSNLFREKQDSLRRIISNLQLDDVEEDDSFKATTEDINRQIILEPVVFGEPEITSHYSRIKQVPPNYHNILGGSTESTLVTVIFPFTGSPELFNAMPVNVQLSFGRVYQPTGQNVPIEVEIPRLDRDLAIREANSQMSITKELISASNKQAEQWNNTINPQIEAMLEQKRKEILSFYGK